MHLHLRIILYSFTTLICIISASPPGTMTFTLDAQFDGVSAPHQFKHVLIEQGQGEGSGGPLRCEPQLIHRSYPVKFMVDWKTCMQKVEKAVDLNDVKIVVVFSTHQGNEQPINVKFRNYRSNDLLDKLFAGGEATIVIYNQADPMLKYKATIATRGAGSSSSSQSHRGNRMDLYHHHLARLLSSSSQTHNRGNGVDETYHYLAPLTPNTPTLEFSIHHNFHPYVFVMASIDVGEEIGKCRAFTQRYRRNMVMNLEECGILNADDLLKVKIHLKFCNGEEHMEKLADFAGKTGEELDDFMSKLYDFMSGYGASIDFHYDGSDHEKPLVHCHKVGYAL